MRGDYDTSAEEGVPPSVVPRKRRRLSKCREALDVSSANIPASPGPSTARHTRKRGPRTRYRLRADLMEARADIVMDRVPPRPTRLRVRLVHGLMWCRMRSRSTARSGHCGTVWPILGHVRVRPKALARKHPYTTPPHLSVAHPDASHSTTISPALTFRTPIPWRATIAPVRKQRYRWRRSSISRRRRLRCGGRGGPYSKLSLS